MMLLTDAGSHHVEFTMFQITQATVNDSRGAAGGSGREVVLLKDQRAYAAPGAFACDCDTRDTTANYHYVEFLVEEFVLLSRHRQLDGRIYSGVIDKNFR